MKIKKIVSFLLIITIITTIFSISASATEVELNDIIIHYYNDNNYDTPYLYYYSDDNSPVNWPGVAMESEGDNWYSYTIRNFSSVKVIFSDNGAEQYPAKNDEGIAVSGEKWFMSGTLYSKNPMSEKISVHYYNSNSWNAPYIYYYNNKIPKKWPGAAMVSDGNGWFSYDIYGFEDVKVIFSNNGNQQIPEKNQEGYDVTGEKWFINGQWCDEEPDGITVHYYDYDNWNNVNIYYYNGNLEGTSWTGVPMYADGDGWYTYKIYGYDKAKVLFNNGKGIQIPGVMQEGFSVSNEMWYRNGTWTTERPQEIVLYFYKPENWSTPNIYYYMNENDTGTAWPGNKMEEVDNDWYSYTITKYSSAKVLFNDGTNQIPAQNEPGFDVSGIIWYKDGIICNMESDSDNDDLPDYTEMAIETDINNSDTDGDGLPDGYEVTKLNTDPLKIDSNNDGINDGDEDLDNDKLSNITEYNLETDPLNADTDGDRLFDGEEVNIYNTDPLNVDTDNDNMSDYTEIQAGLNPLLQDTDSDGIMDNEETITININFNSDSDTDLSLLKVIPTVEIIGKGDYVQNLSINDISKDEVITDVPFVVGSPYEFQHDNSFTFDKCKLTFTLDSTVLLENNINDLMIALYDEDNNSFIPINTTYNESKKEIYADIEHFSIYTVINKKAYYSAYSKTINNDIPENIAEDILTYKGHYYAIIDKSMPWTEAERYCVSIGGHLVTINDNSEQTFIVNALGKAPKKNTYWIGLTGESNHYSWVTGEPLDYRNWATGEPNNPYETAVHMYAKDYEIFKSGEWNDTLNNYNDSNNYYSYSNCGIICEWENNPSNTSEVNGYFIKLSNGKIVHLDKDPSLGDRTVDTDGDGICDIDELGNVISIDIYNPYINFSNKTERLIVYVWTFNSDPTKVDTDGDGETDLEDFDPLNYCIYGELVYYINKLEEVAQEQCNSNSCGCKKGDEKWLVAMFIRHFNPNYINDNWSMTGGAINYDFVNLINNDYTDIYQYFKNHDFVSSKYGTIDVYHFGATLCGYLYETSFFDGADIKYKMAAQLMPEKTIDALSGWAGDLQSLCIDFYEKFDKSVDAITYQTVYSYVYNSLAFNETSSFCQTDLFADIDAVLVYKRCCKNNNTLNYNIEKYFMAFYDTRYDEFYKELGSIYPEATHTIDIDINVEYSVNYFLQKKFASFIEWPLLKRNIYCEPTDNIQIGIKNAFIDYIKEGL